MRRPLSRLRIGRAPRSLKVKLLSRVLLLLAALLLLIGVAQYFWMSRFLYQNKAESIRAQIGSISPDYWLHGRLGGGDGPAFDPDGDDDADARPMPVGPHERGANPEERYEKDKNRSAALLYSDETVSFVDEAGNQTLLSDDPDETESPSLIRLPQEAYDQALKGETASGYRIARDAEGERKLIVLQAVQAHGIDGIVQVSVDTHPLTEVLIRQLAIFVTIAVFALALGWFGLLPVLRRTLTPLRNLVGTVGQIDAGNLAIRLPENQGQLEIDRLSSSFNEMLLRLEGAFAAEKEAKERMRRFVADASHELRTPLTSIHGFLEVLRRGAAADSSQLEKALASMHGETKRINKLVEDLLMLAKLDQAPPPRLERADLAVVTREMEPQLKLLAGSRHWSLELAGPCFCRIDADKWKQVLLNLFQNAVQHTSPESGRILVRLKHASGRAILECEDNGPGIAGEHLPRIFDRFYRVDASRSRQYGGSGLGLSITRSIVESWGGTAAADSELGRGAVFRIELPLDEPD